MIRRTTIAAASILMLMSLVAAAPSASDPTSRPAIPKDVKPARTPKAAGENFKYLAVGMTPDDVDRLFSKDFRGDPDRSSSGIKMEWNYTHAQQGSYTLRCRFSVDGKLEWFDEHRP